MAKPKPLPKPIDPYEYAKVDTEFAQQTALFIWASQNFDKYPQLKYMFAIPNGGSRHIAEASRLVASGVKAGVPDIFLPVKCGQWNGLFIEMKKKKSGVISEEQVKWIYILREQGFGVMICYGFEHAMMNVKAYLDYGIAK